jgi:hypothetical protein
MYRACNVQYEHGDRIHGLASGGIGAMHRLAQHTGLVTAIDEHVEVLKVHLPYHESDHVLGIAYNVLCGGTCLQDIERRRQDEVYLDALGAQRIPDPTTAGDFCRRFDEAAIDALQAAINETRVRVWRAQPAAFFDEAVIDADGTLAETTGQCKDGMDIAYDGMWGYHPLVVSLANTSEPLYLVNRSGNRPSSEGAAARFDQARVLCETAGFRRITFRGDTDFSQTEHLDRWDAAGVRFVFGYDARANLISEADALRPQAWTRLVRRPAYTVQTAPRERPVNVKEAIIVAREFKNLRLEAEAVAEFPYQPVRLEFVVRRQLGAERGPCSGRPTGHGLDQQGPLSVHWRRSAACGRPTIRDCAPRCIRSGSRQASVQDHAHSRTTPGRGILAASSRSSAPRMGGTTVRAARS